MRKTDIEFWALSVMERVENGQPVEDSRVELKADWIEPEKAARRIAGHANSAHGEEILWLIGVDERNRVKGIDVSSFANWFNMVKSQFEGVIPDSTCINVPYRGVTFLAIIFETDRAPFVVKNPSGGTIQFEVPWREGTAIRSANRSELLKILVPFQKTLTFDVLSGALTVHHWTQDASWHWNLDLDAYVSSMIPTPVVIPFHQCSATFSLSQYLPQVAMVEFSMRPPPLWGGFPYRTVTADSPRPQVDSLTIDATRSELIIQGPGKVHLTAKAITYPIQGALEETIAIMSASLLPIESDRRINVEVEMVWDHKNLLPEDSQKGRWIVNPKNLLFQLRNPA